MSWPLRTCASGQLFDVQALLGNAHFEHTGIASSGMQAGWQKRLDLQGTNEIRLCCSSIIFASVSNRQPYPRHQEAK